jgi:TonB family protein
MSDAWELLLEVSVKGTLVLGTAFLLSLALRRASASTRHWLWTVALAAVLLLPLLATVLPAWEAPVPPLASEVLAAPAAAAPLDSRRAQSPAPKPVWLDWPGWAAAVWLAGALLVLARLLLGMQRVRRLARRASSVEDSAWSEALEEASRSLGVAVPVRLLQSPRVALPMTWGVWQPVVLLPDDAGEWPPERRRAVLLHELAHVKRRDCLSQVLAQAACAVHWFNPLVWLAARRLAIERERACDDQVLQLGTRASDYAAQLLEVARSLHRRQSWALASVAMARRSQFEGRLVAILDPSARRVLSRWAAVLAAGALAAVVVPVAAMRPQAPALQTGALTGTIYDATYGVVPNAQVVVIDRHSRVERTTLTGPAGDYSFAALPAGRYDWEVRARGFQVHVRRNVAVEAGRKGYLGAVLRVGSINESIEVTGQGPARAKPEMAPPMRISVGGNVQASKLVRMTRPQYPEGARARGVEGEVLLRAILRTDGSLGEVGVLSAPDAELAQAALEAVRTWRYLPTLLNGKPVEVETTITVSFHLKP